MKDEKGITFEQREDGSKDKRETLDSEKQIGEIEAAEWQWVWNYSVKECFWKDESSLA